MKYIKNYMKQKHKQTTPTNNNTFKYPYIPGEIYNTIK